MHPIQEPYSVMNEDDGLEGIMRTWCWVGVGLWINCGEPCSTWLVLHDISSRLEMVFFKSYFNVTLLLK